ncbi:MAG: NAD(P)H-dependent oxidoreductase [Oscillospiraceae bacterium]|nr:NAD(P)H-dependent oxidoreductase [Oscillospiraceae bacterium]
MKVALINGQNHKGSTYHIGRMLAEKLTGGENVTEVFLPRDMPNFCLGCADCIMKDESACPHYKYIEPITRIIDSADVMIFTSPVYVFHATGSMKALLDHYAYRWMPHRPEEKMFRKQGVCIATAAGAGMRSTIKDMRDSLSFWGVGRIFSYGIAVNAIKWDEVPEKKKIKIEKATSRLSRKILARVGKVRPSLKTILIFSAMRLMQKKPLNQADGAYWAQKGWTGAKRPWRS